MAWVILFPGCFFLTCPETPPGLLHPYLSLLVALLHLPSETEYSPEGHRLHPPDPEEFCQELNCPQAFPHCGGTTVMVFFMPYLLLVRVSVDPHFEVWKRILLSIMLHEVPTTKMPALRWTIFDSLIDSSTHFFLSFKKNVCWVLTPCQGQC